MGFLKHFALPLFAVTHSIFVSFLVTNKKQDIPSLVQWPGAEDERTKMEMHLIGAYCGFHAAMMFACIAGMIHEHAHFRGIVTFMELMVHGIDLADALREGTPWEALAVLTGIAVVGLVIHSMEPGIFTKDKNKEKSG
jgi:hypothetical protein